MNKAIDTKKSIVHLKIYSIYEKFIVFKINNNDNGEVKAHLFVFRWI